MPATRKKRSDNGALRIAPEIIGQLGEILGDDEYPGGKKIFARLAQTCVEQGWACPSRATVYKVIRRGPEPQHVIADLPEAVRAALYNLSDQGFVPGAQLVFFCFNYGTLEAMHFAAGLPWLSLYRADRMRGWRAKSHGMLRGVLRARGIPIA